MLSIVAALYFIFYLLTAAEPIISSPCLTAWKYFNHTDSCYFTGHWETFSQAEATCVRNDAHLVSIHSQQENTYINGLYNPGSHSPNDELLDMTWIGLQRKSTKNAKKKYRNNFMGSFYDLFKILDSNSFTLFLPQWRTSPADWEWTDGTSRDFQNWKEQPPERGKDCVVQRSSPAWNLTWQFVDCNLRVRKYVCKKPARGTNKHI